MERYFNLSLEFDKNRVDEIIEYHIKNEIPGYVCSLDGNNFAVAYTNPSHHDILEGAIVNNVDSSWVPVMINLIYKTNYRNYIGTDLFIEYVRKCRYKQFFLGSNRKVLDGLKKELSKIDPRINGMRFEELPFRKVEEFDYAGIAEMINQDSPDIIWVSLGCPKQEQFMSRLKPYLKRGVMFGFGAIFNFYAGEASEERNAPKWMSNNKIEWVYRYILNPKKQGKRLSLILRVFPKAFHEERKRARKHSWRQPNHQ
ncbi:MAG: WecB/TagA/CpsF family glycosyltransferase [Lachnospiraceae bacterium]|nr:WecB/TagA/CpsF family glycosyltransferase [Lachnospiraceae bacterium]